MTPKEKAIELVRKYEKKLMYDYNDYHYTYNLGHCKQCALIAIDELINYYDPFGDLEEVKQEIEKL